MAEFFQTADVRFLRDQGPVSTPSGAKVQTSFGDIEVLPEDRERLSQLIGGYESEIDDMANILRQNPKKLSQLRPRLEQIKRNFRNDLQFGEVAKMTDDFKRVNDIQEAIRERYKDNPFLTDYAMNKIKIGDLKPDGRRDISMPLLTDPWTSEKAQDWVKTATANLKDRIIKRADQKGIKISPTQNVFEIGHMVGMTEDDVTQALIGQVSPEDVESVNMFFELRGVPHDESRFFENGKLHPDTVFGKLIKSIARGRAFEKFEGVRTTGTDYGLKAREEARAKGTTGATSSTNIYTNAMNNLVSILPAPGTFRPGNVLEGALENLLKIEPTEQEQNVNIKNFTQNPDGTIDMRIERMVPDIGKEKIARVDPKPVRLNLDFLRNRVKTVEEWKEFVSDLKRAGMLNEKLEIINPRVMASQSKANDLGRKLLSIE